MKISVPRSPWAMLEHVPKEHRPLGTNTSEVTKEIREKLADQDAATVLLSGALRMLRSRSELGQFWFYVANQLLFMLRDATRAQDPAIYLAEAPSVGGSAESPQYIWHFSVSDEAKERDPLQINWHGQNTSQWVYAGAIVLQDGEVSVHT